jgi:hypothetical protein
VHYDTSRATFKIDGRVGTQNELEVGDVVTVTGTLGSSGLTGTADTVTFDDNVEGPIASLDAVAGTFVVLGQTVIVDADTSFDNSIRPASLAGLAVGDVVEVSGLVASDGSVRATRIETKPAAQELEITGVVASHAAATKRFNINAQVVDYSAAMLDNFPAGLIADGQLVEVKGTTVSGGVLAATRWVRWRRRRVSRVRAPSRRLDPRFVSAADFAVAGVAVTTTRDHVRAATPRPRPQRKSRSRAISRAGGVLAASKSISPRRGRALDRAVDSVNVTAGSFVMLGVTVKVDTLRASRTELDSAAAVLARQSSSGDVEVRGELPRAAARCSRGPSARI